MKNEIEVLRKVLHEKITSKEDNQGELIKISKQLDKLILRYYRSKKDRMEDIRKTKGQVNH